MRKKKYFLNLVSCINETNKKAQISKSCGFPGTRALIIGIMMETNGGFFFVFLWRALDHQYIFPMFVYQWPMPQKWDTAYLPSMAKFSQPTERIVSKFLLTLFSTSLGYNPLVTIRMTKNGADWTDILNLTLFWNVSNISRLIKFRNVWGKASRLINRISSKTNPLTDPYELNMSSGASTCLFWAICVKNHIQLTINIQWTTCFQVGICNLNFIFDSFF